MAKAKRVKRKAKNASELAVERNKKGPKAAKKLKSRIARAAAALERVVDRATGKAKKRPKLSTRIEPPRRAGSKKSRRRKLHRGTQRTTRADLAQAAVSGGVRVPRRR